MSKPKLQIPEISPRLPYYADEPHGALESLNDWYGHNQEAVEWFLENRDRLVALLDEKDQLLRATLASAEAAESAYSELAERCKEQGREITYYEEQEVQFGRDYTNAVNQLHNAEARAAALAAEAVALRAAALKALGYLTILTPKTQAEVKQEVIADLGAALARPLPEAAASPWQSFWDDMAQWSQATFGADNGDPRYCITHLAREVKELQERPLEGEEYADCIMLLFDAFRRKGGTLAELLVACKEKLERNKKRQYGPPDTEGVREHIKPVPEAAARWMRMEEALREYANKDNWANISRDGVHEWHAEWVGQGEGYDLAQAAMKD